MFDTKFFIDKLNYDVLYDNLVDNQFHFDYNISILRLSHPNKHHNSILSMFSDEIFRPIIGFNNYQISNFGRVKNQYNYIMTSHTDRDNYCEIQLSNDNKRKDFMIHHLVAECYLSNPYNYRYVKHKDNNTLNNHVDNLYYTNKQNKAKTTIIDLKTRYISYKTHRKQFYVRIYFKRQEIHLGHYNTLEEAQKVRDDKLIELTHEFEQMNKVETNILESNE